MKQPIQKFTTAPAPSGTPVIALPKRAYEGDAPIPMISARTLTLFHDKPPKEPVKNLDHPVVGTKSAGHPLETINIGTANQPNKAAQAWKHMLSSFRLSPKGGGDPPVALKRKIEATFGIPDSWEATINDYGNDPVRKRLVIDQVVWRGAETGEERKCGSVPDQGYEPRLTTEL